MKKYMGIGQICNGLAAILEVAALVACLMMRSEGKSVATIVYVVAAVAILLQMVSLLSEKKVNTPVLWDGVSVITAVMYASALILMVKGQMSNIVKVFSDHVGTVGKPFMLATMCFIVAIVLKVIAGFMRTAADE